MRKSQVFVYPLENRVAFPYHQFQTSIISDNFEAKNCDYLIGFVTITDTDAKKVLEIDGVSQFGTLMRIHNSSNSLINGQIKSNNYSLVGLNFARFKIISLAIHENGYLADIQIFDDQIPNDVEKKLRRSSIYQKLKKQLSHYYQCTLNKTQAKEKVHKFQKQPCLNKVLFNTLSRLDLSISQSLQFLQLNDIQQRIQTLTTIVSRKTENVIKSSKIDNDDKILNYPNNTNVSKQFQKHQRASSLVNKIQKEVQKRDLPEYVRDEMQKEMESLTENMTEEKTVTINYLNTLLSLPWNVITQDNTDLKSASKLLNAEHQGLKKIKQRILQFLAVRFRGGNTKGNVLCLCGPPGVGKTSIAKSIASAMGRKLSKISLAGVSDQAQFRGHRRTYKYAMPGTIIRSLIKCKSSNPVILLDEIQKLGGDVTSTLLQILDPSQNSSFVDHYVGLPYDLSKVLFICTSNSTETMSHPLLNRLEIINLPGYTKEEKFEIAYKHIIPNKIRDNCVSDILRFENEAIRQIVQHCDQMGVRNLQRNIDKICRKTALKGTSTKFTKKDVQECLGSFEASPIWSRIGAIKSLCSTNFGGKVMMVEAVKYAGKGKINMTGNLGDMLKESVCIAISWIRSNLGRLPFLNENEFQCLMNQFQNTDVHVHLPSGSVKKDYTSAGIAIVCSLVSAIFGLTPNKDVAMAGQITLSGRILGVSGILQKITAAANRGISQVILPFQNKYDVQEIQLKNRKNMRFLFVNSINQVLDHIFDQKQDFQRSKL